MFHLENVAKSCGSIEVSDCEGRIVQPATPDEWIGNPSRAYVARFIHAQRMPRAAEIGVL